MLGLSEPRILKPFLLKHLLLSSNAAVCCFIKGNQLVKLIVGYRLAVKR